ncbi:E3 ubiquitin-protein ligase RNF6 [Elephas maximus indicus]|uniref:E3 ubiquitin-protein ligase RNF6 n=1 Tax=Elephas maximus indicus TaxID=99487 RepID=UPI00211626EF|nr:E3 ubiquitin-protein ligase RNF6 [Elephas maximus indicus]XP_049723827.1 E3 ubiquitin-protein ligase RNF6 [Elephas maximus indicus]XP_049723828.1 E3 ubiquitin-protein ligase RNF6 [Elephas maximus indicus]
MSQSRSRSDDGGEESSFQDHDHRENERRWQQERLRREEAYYQFINELSDEDYRLMRDHNLLGTPGEITSEELQQRLVGVKEQIASQPDLRNRENGTNTRGSEARREISNDDSLLEWLNTFRRTGNATRSGQNGNQTWRAVSRTNPDSGEFRFSLEIHINDENRGFEIHGEDYASIPLSDTSRDHTRNRHQRSDSPVARRTRSQTSVNFSGNNSNTPRTSLGSEGQNSVDVSYATLGGLRSGVGGSVGIPRTHAPRANVNDHTNQSGDSELRQREGQRFGAAHVWENGARTNVTVRNTNQRLEPIRLRSSFSSRSRSPIQRQSGTVDHNSQRESRASQHTVRRSARRRGIARGFLEQDRETRGTTSTPFPNSRLVSRITVEEEESSRSPVDVRRHPTITLDLQVRRIRRGENRDRDSIANRTRSRVGLAENTVLLESNSGGFRRTVSRLERSGIRTYVSTITVPLRRISENELVEPSSVSLRSILRQIMTGFGELSSLMEAEPEPEIERSGQHLPEMQSDLSDSGTVNDSSQHNEGSSEDRQAQEDSTGMRGESDTTQPHAQNSDSTGDRQLRNTDNLVETGTLPILRLAHFFLLNQGDGDERVRGLTKEQIDNLSTRNYEHNSIDSELSKVCSVCISDYVTGNKLRQLPCMHEFHIHCIDRWLSENCTCPICRQPVLGSSIANSR